MTQERTYRAPEFAAALAQVKAELGPEAIILSSRQVPAPLGGETCVEIKAVSEKGAAELGVRASTPTSGKQSGGIVERRLARMGVPATAARTLARRVAMVNGSVPISLSLARPALTEVLEQEMLFGGSVAESASRTIALVGPTGVGKTTTVAKIAAHEALVRRRRIALISLDHYRVAGVEQLQRFADLMGVPMETAHDPASLGAALRRFGDADLILIDTPGRSPRDRQAVSEMGAMLHGTGEPIEVQLCIAAATAERELRSTIDLHGALRPTRLISTKVDEAFYHGTIVAAQVMAGLPITYLTTGQRVPEDIEVAGPARVAALLCGEEVHA